MLYLPYISPTSPLHLPYTSPIPPRISPRSFLLSVGASLLLVVLITALGIIYTFCGGEPGHPSPNPNPSLNPNLNPNPNPNLT